ncbi:MAG TPA: GDP-mannose 4,6-dehydratase, partial [Pseudomonadota bacterium]|nr:GDP-mannose 4,6-dehydratase [Pseudomonadota bacterium]
MSIYLVTGGCGFIGSNLVHALLQRGDEVRILDNLSSGRFSNIGKLLDSHPRQVSLWR